MVLASDFLEFAETLNANGVEYLIVGGYAVGYHGHVRTTGDLDVLIRCSPENARQVVAALDDFGMPHPELEQYLAVPGKMYAFGRPPLRIDLITRVDGLEFDDAYAARETLEIDGVTVPFVGLNHLRQNRAASGRLKDLADLESLPCGSNS